MHAQISQPLLSEAFELENRREIVAAIARVRQRIEREAGQCVMPNDIANTLLQLCHELGLTQFEIIEAMGSTWAVDQLWCQLAPITLPRDDLDNWMREHEDIDLGPVLLKEC